MKRGKFIKHLHANGCSLYREGSKHSIFMNTDSGKKFTVPRHTELHNDFCKEMCKQLGIPVIS